MLEENAPFEFDPSKVRTEARSTYYQSESNQAAKKVKSEEEKAAERKSLYFVVGAIGLMATYVLGQNFVARKDDEEE